MKFLVQQRTCRVVQVLLRRVYQRHCPLHCSRYYAYNDAVGGDGYDTGEEPEGVNDLNHLHTLLKRAIDAEDYARAAAVRDRIDEVVRCMSEGSVQGGHARDWSSMGVLDWLVDRVVDLGYRVPTSVQSRAAVVLEEKLDCIIQAPTGSGKTLAFLVPSLSLLSYPPETYPDDLQGPQLLIVVPTRELGVQIAMIVYKLFGGNINPGIPGIAGNMFSYSGPRGLKVKGLVLEEEVEQAVTNRYIQGAHVVVGTPDLIASALERGVEVAQHCVAVCVDEADACYKMYPEQMDMIMHTSVTRETNVVDAASENKTPLERPVVVLSGATLSVDLLDHASQDHWLTEDHVEILIGLEKNQTMSSRIKHRYVPVNKDSDILGALCRTVLEDQNHQNLDSQPNRGIIYVANEEIARRISEPLRNIFWGRHSISVLLPGGSEPIKNLHAFRDNKTSILIATSSSSRGLDLPSVTHVYSTFVPSDENEYVHMAGRMGRIGGGDTPGVITTIMLDDSVPSFMDLLTNKLHVPSDAIEQVAPPAPMTIQDFTTDEEDSAPPPDDVIEDAKRSLETMLYAALMDDKDSGSDTE